MSVIDKLNEALETAKERGKVYGNNGFAKNGAALASFFRDGITLRTPDDFSRFLIFALCSVKMARYAENFEKGGHKDSAHDLGVYAFLLEDFDDGGGR
jgi:hypothetical protein